MAEIFKIEQETLQVDLFGEVITINAPTSLQEESVQEAFSSYDSTTALKHPTTIYKDFFVGLGLAREKLDLLSSKQLMALFAFVVGSKKN